MCNRRSCYWSVVLFYYNVVVQFSVCLTLPPPGLSAPGPPVFHYLPAKFVKLCVHQLSDAIQPSSLCCPLLLLPSFPSIGVFSAGWLFLSGSQSIGAWHQSFQWSISGLISFKDKLVWSLAVPGFLRRLLPRHHKSQFCDVEDSNGSLIWAGPLLYLPIFSTKDGEIGIIFPSSVYENFTWNHQDGAFCLESN